MDEILPEVKQKNQIGYLNCTVVNKGSESVVSTDLHNDHVSTMLNTALVLLNAIKDVYWKRKGEVLNYYRYKIKDSDIGGSEIHVYIYKSSWYAQHVMHTNMYIN